MSKKHKKFSLWAKKRLLDLELTVTQLASKIGYPRQTVSAALNGSERFPHVTSAIATTLNHDPKTDGPLPARPARPEQRFRFATA
jgi:DNA transposition AAA+ family ATPase